MEKVKDGSDNLLYFNILSLKLYLADNRKWILLDNKSKNGLCISIRAFILVKQNVLF